MMIIQKIYINVLSRCVVVSYPEDVMLMLLQKIVQLTNIQYVSYCWSTSGSAVDGPPVYRFPIDDLQLDVY